MAQAKAESSVLKDLLKERGAIEKLFVFLLPLGQAGLVKATLMGALAFDEPRPHR